MSDTPNKGKKNADLLNSPWFQSAYKSALEFYEKDQVLDGKDRLALHEKYKKIARGQLLSGWLGFTAVFGTPFVYRYYTTGAIRGVKVPRNFILGLVAMAATSHLAGNSIYQYQLNSLEYTPLEKFGTNEYGDRDATTEQQVNHQKTSDQKQYEMMRVLNNGSPTRWSMYFYTTFHHPERKLPDPKVKLQQMKELASGFGGFNSPIMHQRDPLGLYSKGPSGKNQENGVMRQSETVKNGAPSSFKEELNPQETNSRSSWDKVLQKSDKQSSWDRVRNGTLPSTSTGETGKDDLLSSDITCLLYTSRCV